MVGLFLKVSSRKPPAMAVFYFIMSLFLLYLCAVAWLYFKEMLEIKLSIYWVTDLIFFFPLLYFCKPILQITGESEELGWTRLPWKCNYFVFPISLARFVSSLLRLTLEIEMSAVPGWELLHAELLTLLHRSCGRVSRVPGKRVYAQNCVDQQF